MDIREMIPGDWNRVFEIYKQGIDSGKATFTQKYPTWEEWDEAHHKTCRYIALHDGEIAGFVAVSPTTAREPYRGVVEVSVYVDEKHRRQGVGTSLLKKLIEEAPRNGFWCLYASIFRTNENSLRLHTKCGFRTIGYRERIAKDKFGTWMDAIVMEYRLPDALVNGEDICFKKMCI